MLKKAGASRAAGSPSQLPGKSSKFGTPLSEPPSLAWCCWVVGLKLERAGGRGNGSFGKLSAPAGAQDLDSEVSLSELLAAVQAMRQEVGDSLGQVRAEIGQMKIEIIPRKEFADLAERIQKMKLARACRSENSK